MLKTTDLMSFENKMHYLVSCCNLHIMWELRIDFNFIVDTTLGAEKIREYVHNTILDNTFETTIETRYICNIFDDALDEFNDYKSILKVLNE